VLLVQQ